MDLALNSQNINMESVRRCLCGGDGREITHINRSQFSEVDKYLNSEKKNANEKIVGVKEWFIYCCAAFFREQIKSKK